MKSGYTLIELVVALLMASLITLSLFQLLSQTRRIVRRITNVIEVDEPFIGFYTQLEKDITGMFAPQSSIQAFVEKEKSSKEAPKPQEGGQKPGEPAKKPEPQKPEQKKPQKVIENVFSLNAQQDQFFWSFITTGALNVLDTDGTPLPAPSVRRVAYVLERDPQRMDVYRLMYRFSSEQLDVNAFKSADFKPSYELVSGIKQFEIEFTLFEVAEKKAGTAGSPGAPDAQAAGAKPADRRPATVKEWNEAEIFQKYKTLIPAYVRLKGTRVDAIGNQYPFEFMFKVYAYNPVVQKEKSLFEELERIAQSIFTGGPQR